MSPPARVRFFVHGRVSGIERRVVLRNAPFPHRTFKPKHARKIAQHVLAQWAVGKDPFEKPEPKRITTLQQAAQTYINELKLHAASKTIQNLEAVFLGVIDSSTTQRRYRYRCLVKYLNRDILALTREEARTLHTAIYNEARSRAGEVPKKYGGRVADDVVCTLLNAVFNHHTRDIVPRPPNPCAAISKHDRFSSKFGVGRNAPRPATERELQSLIWTLNEWKWTPEHRAVCLLQLLCGWREERARSLRWAHVMPNEIVIPPDVNRKTRREFRMPITPLLRELLDWCRTFGSEEWLTPQANRFLPINSANWWRRWASEAGVQAFTSHNVRDTVATWVANLNANPIAGDSIIDHINKVSGVSDRYQGFEQWKRQWLQKWHDHLVSKGLVICPSRPAVARLLPSRRKKAPLQSIAYMR